MAQADDASYLPASALAYTCETNLDMACHSGEDDDIVCSYSRFIGLNRIQSTSVM